MSGFWTWVFAVGAAQGVFLCAVLLLRRSANRTTTRLLAALVGVATTMIVSGAMGHSLPEPVGGLLMFLNINTELALGPLFLLFARSLVDPGRRLVRRDAVHFVPLVAGTGLWAIAWVILGDTGRRFAFLDSAVVPLYMLFKIVWLFSYVALTYDTLRGDARVTRIHAVGRQPDRLSWLRHAVLALAAMAGSIYVADFAARFGLVTGFAADPYSSLVLAVMIYMASLMVLQRPWVLALRPSPAPAKSLDDEAARLKDHLETERPWLRPELNLGELADALGTTDNHLSTVIRDGLDTSFYALLSRCRLAEFERLARDPALVHRSVLELAYEAGFNSKASFYRVFRESHGTTPRAFRAAI